MWKVTTAEFVTSAVSRRQYPEHTSREIVFLGRSNVGKSSLINYLCGRKKLARISGTPGKTRTINFYDIGLASAGDAEGGVVENKQFCLVDLPGYGYAKVARSLRASWQKFIEEYLLKAPRLAMVVQLIDARHEPLTIDGEVHRWLGEQNFQLALVATKVDKLNRNARQRQLAILEKAMPLATGSLIGASVVEKFGGDLLLAKIASCLEENK